MTLIGVRVAVARRTPVFWTITPSVQLLAWRRSRIEVAARLDVGSRSQAAKWLAAAGVSDLVCLGAFRPADASREVANPRGS